METGLVGHFLPTVNFPTDPSSLKDKPRYKPKVMGKRIAKQNAVQPNLINSSWAVSFLDTLGHRKKPQFAGWRGIFVGIKREIHFSGIYSNRS